jgi:phosphomannomutase
MPDTAHSAEPPRPSAFVAAHTPLIVSVSGLRGVVGDSLTPAVAARYVTAFVAGLPAGPVVVGRDGRASGPAIVAALTAALRAAGRDVVDCGVAATPSIGIAVRDTGAAGGVQVSASHNPARYNGLKLFSSAGRVLPAAVGAEVKARFEAATDEPSTGAGQPGAASGMEAVTAHDAVTPHVKRVADIVDAAAIRRRRPKVWIDCCHGAGSRAALPLLEHLGCEVVAIGAEPDGAYDHEPEPTEENLAAVLPRIAAADADVGFFQDPDADRLAIADAAGRYLGEECTLALAVDAVLAQRPGPIVVNCSTSGMAAELAARYGVPCAVSAVGEANVVDAMLASDAVLGGEGNGGVIDPRIVLVRDSLVAMALVLERLATAETDIASWAATLPRFVMRKTKLDLAPGLRGDAFAAALDRLVAAFPEARASRLDGLRLDWPGGWLLVRSSNTEPIVRIVAEAADETAVDAAVIRAAACLGG